jgi:hypothetical protein
MVIGNPLALYDEGVTIVHVIDRLLRDSGERKLDVGTSIIRAALEMPDSSSQRIRTPVKREIGSGCLEVGDTIIAISGSPCENFEEETRDRIILCLDDVDLAARRNSPPRTTLVRLSLFVGQIVTLRAVGTKALVRRWLERLCRRLVLA